MSKNIDWVNVKSGFKDDFKNIVNKAYSQTNSLEKKILGNLFIQIIIETLVDNLVTPKNLILLVNDPDKYKDLIEDKLENPIKKINYIQKINYEEKEEKDGKTSHGVEDLRLKMKARGGKLKAEDFLS